jgi:hypothetical protein
MAPDLPQRYDEKLLATSGRFKKTDPLWLCARLTLATMKATTFCVTGPAMSQLRI